MIKICSYVGSKDRFIQQLSFLLPKRFTSAWETCGGSASMSLNLLNGFNLEELLVTELEKGMYCLLSEVKNHPIELYNKLLKSEYSEDIFNKATLAENAKGDELYKGYGDLDIAYFKYILCAQSYNAGGSIQNFRDIDKYSENDFRRNKIAYDMRRRYKNQLYKRIICSSQAMGNIRLENRDMFYYFEDYVVDEDKFIYIDMPYTNGLRTTGIYIVDTDILWHKKFLEKLVELRNAGKLKAKIMISNYVNLENLEEDFYANTLSDIGFDGYLIKKVKTPVIAGEGTNRKAKMKNESVVINYSPCFEGYVAEGKFISKKGVD